MSKYNPQYAERDVEEYHDLYLRHLMAMTTERLHSKMSIAAELAWRDSEIERLKNNGLAEMLSTPISKAFDNEEQFIRKLIFPKIETHPSPFIKESKLLVKIHSIHMASGETKISIKYTSGCIKDLLISTADFIEWCDHVRQ